MRNATLQVVALVLVSIFASTIVLAANPDHIGAYEQNRDRDGRMPNINEYYQGTKQGADNIAFDSGGILDEIVNWIVSVGDKVRHRHSYQNAYDWNYYYDGRYKPEKDN